MLDILVSNIGRVIEGSVYDVQKKPFLRALKQLDDQLYIKWNPNKNSGRGLWEIRRRPNTKIPVLKTVLGDAKIFELEYVENDLVHHVLDAPALHYGLLSRLKEMDAWDDKNWLTNMDYLARKKEAKYQAAVDQSRKDLIRENRKYFKDLQEYVRSGYNPAWFFTNKK